MQHSSGLRRCVHGLFKSEDDRFLGSTKDGKVCNISHLLHLIVKKFQRKEAYQVFDMR